MYTYIDIKKASRSSDSWIGTFFINHLNFPAVYLIANYTNIRPEYINIFSLIVGVSAAYFYFQGSRNDLFIGGLLFVLSYVLDGVDGKLARLKGLRTNTGALLEAFRDKIVHVSCLFGLIAGQFLLRADMIIIYLTCIYVCLLLLNSFLTFRFLRNTHHVSFAGSLASIKALEYLPSLKIGKQKVYPCPSITEVLFLLFLGSPIMGVTPSLFLTVILQTFMVLYLKKHLA